jgi:hypothetical protein
MNSCTHNSFCRLSLPQPLEVRVRTDVSAPPLAREPVQTADLSNAVAEAWRDQCLRRGRPDQILADLRVVLRPAFSGGDGGARCSGFELELELPDGGRRRQQFSLKCLRPVATRAAAALVSAGILRDEQHYFYELAVATQPAPAPPVEVGPAFSLKASSPPPACLRMPLRPLLRAATPVAMLDEEAFPVFFTAAALAKAEACSRQGARSVPPVESGGVLVGSLASCEVTGEFFALVTDVLEVVEAEQSTFTLAYSGLSWRRIETIMKARQAAHPAQMTRLLGQCHGHNFLPHDGNRCDQCDRRPVCGLSSVFVSPDDQTWMGAVFARQPWALCLIFGLNARNEPVRQLYSLNDGRWQARGYFVLADFDWQDVALRHSATP